MLTNHPEGKHWNEYLSGIRYISRLDNLPYSDLTDIDHHIKHELLRFRGVPVREVSGLGINGHHICFPETFLAITWNLLELFSFETNVVS
jgi:hypothetical protein